MTHTIVYLHVTDDVEVLVADDGDTFINLPGNGYIALEGDTARQRLDAANALLEAATQLRDSALAAYVDAPIGEAG